jgi:uncharacterized damage-inducible protein DinB
MQQMLPMETIRKYEFDQLNKSLKVVEHILSTASPADLTTYRDGGSGWTVLEVLCHLRDFEAVFFERARLIVEQDYPDLPFPDPPQLARERRYNEQDVRTVFEEWTATRVDHLAYLEGLAEEDWERAGNHPVRGRYTLHDGLLLAAWHDVNHMEQMVKILAGKQTG